MFEGVDPGVIIDIVQEEQENWELVSINDNKSLTKVEDVMGYEDQEYVFLNKTFKEKPLDDTPINPTDNKKNNDKKKEPVKNIVNPSTGDNLRMYIALLLISGITMFSANYFIKKNKNI